MATLYAVVLAGGSGTRFWPASRKTRPKQLLSIAPGSAKSLIRATVERIAPLVPAERVLVATGEALLEATRQALPELPSDNFLGEPFARNTAPCIGWATARISRMDPDAVVMVLPSDHHIGDEPAFLAAIGRAVSSAESGPITTIGIQPARAETGYGYLEAGEDLGNGVRRVARFVEKPNRELATQYLNSGKHFWNSGMFFFRASAMLGAILRHMPELAAGLQRIEQARNGGAMKEAEETRKVFEQAASISIDYGVMEKEAGLCMVSGSFGWNDLGSWQSAWELSAKDAEGNAVDDSVLLLDAGGNLVENFRSDGKRQVIALVGVSELCVVQTDDALLIIPRDRSQDVRRVVDQLRESGREDLL